MSSPEPDLAPPAPRIGYVLKMFPRFSETFVLSEVLAMESLGADLRIFSLRQPADGRFHERLAEVRAEVTYLPYRLRATELWRLLRSQEGILPGLAEHLDELFAVDPDEAAAAVELAAACRREQLDHLHAHFGSVATTVARLAALLAGIGYSFTAHAKDIFHEEVDPHALRRKLEDARFVVTVSDFNLDHLRARFGASADGVVRLYNGLDLARLPYRPPSGRDGSVVAVGRLVQKKGFHHLVDALALLRVQGRRVPLQVVGSGAEEQPLRDRVAELGLDDLVTFHGALPQGRMLDVLSRASAMAAPCVVGDDGNRDGLPTVLLESLATGTPCVSTPVTGIPEAVVDGETGLLVPEADPAALADALQRLLDDEVLGRRLADRGRGLVEERFDVTRNAAELHRLIGASVARPAPSRAPAAPDLVATR
jgi:colanic acid/amylovoran biosynthesis glycosyltransferase